MTVISPMRVLAIDTALEACAAAVLDTEQRQGGERIAADGARPRRGADAADRPRHAPGRHAVLRARPHRRHHRPRQLHRAARRHLGGARHRARGRQAGVRPHHARRLRRAAASPRTTRPRSRSRSTPATSTSICRCSGRADARWSRRASPASPTRCAPPPTGRSRIVGTGARHARGRLARERTARRSLVEDRRAPDIVWVGAARASPPTDSPGAPKPLYLRAPDAQPQDAARLPRR